MFYSTVNYDQFMHIVLTIKSDQKNNIDKTCMILIMAFICTIKVNHFEKYSQHTKEFLKLVNISIIYFVFLLI